jgi:hypothetical protein
MIREGEKAAELQLASSAVREVFPEVRAAGPGERVLETLSAL